MSPLRAFVFAGYVVALGVLLALILGSSWDREPAVSPSPTGMPLIECADGHYGITRASDACYPDGWKER